MSAKQWIWITGKPTLDRGDLSLKLRFSSKSLKIIETPFGVVLDLEGAHLFGEPGTPGFPVRTLRLALPPFSDITNLHVAVTKRSDVTAKPVFVAPVQEPRPGLPGNPGGKVKIKPSLYSKRQTVTEVPIHAMDPPGVTLPRMEEYRKVLAQPVSTVRVANVEHRGVATLLTFEVRPLSQKVDGIIELATEIAVKVNYQSTTESKAEGTFVGSKHFRPARTKAEAKLLANILKGEVLNPDWIIDISDLISNRIAQNNYLIITDNHQWDADNIVPTSFAGDLKNAFQKLVEWKKRRGLRASVITITDIVQGTYGDFKTNARDLQEVIRNFLKWAYIHWDISWVLLGGDVNIVPVRIVAAAESGHILVEDIDPPNDNRSYWTGTYLKMHVVNPGLCWPGDWDLILVNPSTGSIIPYDPTITSDKANPGWYYTKDDTYTIPSATMTHFVIVNGPPNQINAKLQWLYQSNRIPTDMYYASLVGPDYGVVGRHDWDLTNNGLYGQHTLNAVDLDGVNYAADAGVGRAPVASPAEAEVFVEKVIAYEQFRQPDGTLLDNNWPRRLTVVSSNWGKYTTLRFYKAAGFPPGDNQYYPIATTHYSLLKLHTPFSDIQWHLFAVVTETDIRIIPYDPEAANLGRGWYFAKSETDLSVSEMPVSDSGNGNRIPAPTRWVVVYGYTDEVAPSCFIFDKAEADLSITNQELLRKQIAADFPEIDIIMRLYQDEIDLPPEDATSPPVDHLTGGRLHEVLNHGQHFVSLSGHGSQSGCCELNDTIAQNTTNGYHTFIAYADSCLTNDFHTEDAMSENLIKNPDGGAVAYVGSTRFSWIGRGDDYQREFFNRLKTVRHLALLNDSRFNIPNYNRLETWIKLSLNLLGDPEMPVWVGKPKTMQVFHPEVVPNHAVVVKVATPFGDAIADATVSLAHESEVFTAMTDTTGETTFFILPTYKDTIEVVVTAIDYIPYLGIMVAPLAPPTVITIEPT